MSTFIINLNDTVALSDSTLIELAKVVNSNQQYVQDAATNYDDVRIVFIICVVIILVVLIASITFYHSLRIKYKYQTQGKEKAYEQEKEIINLEYKRKKEEEDDKSNRYEKKVKIDLEKDLSYEKNKTDHQKAGEFIKQVCDSVKDKDGKFDNDTLEILLRFFREEWMSSESDDNHVGNSCNN